MQQFKKIVQTWGKPMGIIILLVIAFFAGNVPSFSKQNNGKPHVLGVQVIPTPTITSAPTSVPVTVINNIIVPTSAPSNVSPAPTSAPVIVVVTPTVAPTIQPTETPSPGTMQSPASPTPTPVAQTVTVQVDYAGEHADSTYTTVITVGETAWEAIQNAVGLSNLHYTDYGGSLGVFITGFNGFDANANQYYEFQVNGTSSNVGVSSYIIVNGDILRFVLTGF